MKSIVLYDIHGSEDFIKNPLLVFDALRVERSLFFLEMEGYEVGLYSMNSHPEKYAENDYVRQSLDQAEKFPMVYVDDERVLEGRYPRREELAQWSEMDVEDFPNDPPVSEVASFLSMISGGGCSTPGACSTCTGGCGYRDEEDLDFEEIEF